MQKIDKKFDVIIAGGGPVGVLTANLLGLYQIHTLVIEKEDQAYSYPRAISLDDEALRILQLIGFTEADINKLVILSRIEYFSKEVGYRLLEPNPHFKPYGYPMLSAYLQPELEVQLRQKLKQYPSVTFISQCELIDYSQAKNQVNVKVNHHSQLQSLQCQYLLGCDGGNSTVRQIATINLTGMTFQQRWLVVDLYDSPELQHNIEKCKNDVYKGRPMLGTMKLPKQFRRFEVRLDHEHFNKGDVDEENVIKILKPFLENTNTKIIRRRVYDWHIRLSEHFNIGNVFLLGDAAHLLPPFGGQGFCSGIRDAVNLAWKIRLCLKQNAIRSVLDTYETERRTHLIAVTEFVKKISDQLEHKDTQEAPKLSKIDINFYRKIKPLPNYNNGLVISSPYAGELLPQPLVICNEKQILLDDILGKYFAIISLNSKIPLILNDKTFNFWKKIGCNYLSVFTDAKHVIANHDLAIMAQLVESIGLFSDNAVEIIIVRPDRIILATCQYAQLEAITEQFMALIDIN